MTAQHHQRVRHTPWKLAKRSHSQNTEKKRNQTSWIAMTSWCSPDGPDKMTRWRMAGSFHAKMCACSWECMDVYIQGMFALMYVCMHACIYVRMSACMSVCMPVCLNVCMLAYLCVSVCLWSTSTGSMVTPPWRAWKSAFSPDHWQPILKAAQHKRLASPEWSATTYHQSSTNHEQNRNRVKTTEFLFWKSS